MNPLRARVAAPASVRRNTLKTIVQTIAFWSVFLAIIPWIILRGEEAISLDSLRWSAELTRLLGAALFVAGGTLGLWSAWCVAQFGQGTPLPFDAPRNLVTSGPYAVVRNPMAIGGLTQGIAVGLMVGSPFVILYALCGGPVWHFAVRPWEEADLKHRFSESFTQYRAHVRCWIPRLQPFRPENASTASPNRE